MRQDFCARVFHAYAGNYMGDYDKIIVAEVVPILKETDFVYGLSSESVGSCLLGMASSDWNLQEGRSVVSKLQAVEYVCDVLLSKVSKMGMLFFVVGSEDLNIMIMSQYALTSDGGLFVISVFGFKDMMVSTLDCSGLFGENFARLTFYEDTDDDRVFQILDTIAHAFLRRSLICVDVADLKCVMGGRLSVGIRFDSRLKYATSSFDSFVLKYEDLIRQTTGLFVFLVFDKNVEFGIDFIDSIVERLKSFVNPNAAMFFSIDYMREQVDEFSCVMVVNV